MQKISVVLTVLNEEKNIQTCLESVSWADEIIVVDDGSTDKTVAIVKKFTKKIFVHKSEGFVEPARNFSLSKASGDWILLLDADETVTPTLAEKLRELAKQSEYSSIAIPRKNIIFSKWIEHSGWWPDYNVRFFKKGTVIWKNEIHSKPEVSGKTLTLDPKIELALIHENYSSITQFLTKMNAYTSIEAQEQALSGKQFSLSMLIVNPMQEFLSRFFAREGFKDGLHGFVLALLEGVSSLVVALKLWEKTGFKEEEYGALLPQLGLLMRDQYNQLKYWVLSTAIKGEKNTLKKSLLKIKRKLSL